MVNEESSISTAIKLSFFNLTLSSVAPFLTPLSDQRGQWGFQLQLIA